jgi:hypothetical protein
MIWLKDAMGISTPMTNDEEAISTRHRGHSQVKTLEDYRRSLYNIFKECHRVLKPNRWMVLTFHNREFKVWNAIHLAAHDAGFVWAEKDGMIYQPPIQAYVTTLHQRAAGSMLGDFILSYQKTDKKPKRKLIEEVEIGNKISQIAKETIEYHGGAKLSTIYMRLMPFLLNNNLLDKMGEKDIETYLKVHFVRKDDKWYIKEEVTSISKEVALSIEEYAPVKKRIESIVRRYLYNKGVGASMDEILDVVYSRLINSNAAEYDEITTVVNRICIKIKPKTAKREIYQLKEERDLQLLFKTTEIESQYSEDSDHDMIIERLVELGKKKGYESHIGETEQKKDIEFRKKSLPMGDNVQYGLHPMAFDRIRQIDTLWIQGRLITAAFEVENSTSIDSGITRLRELFASAPNLQIPAFIIIPDKREKEAKKKIGSLDNRQAGVTERIRYILYSDLLDKGEVEIESVARSVI